MNERPEQIQSVVTVVAFRPLDDSVLIYKSPNEGWKLPSTLLDNRVQSINDCVNKILGDGITCEGARLVYLSDKIVSDQFQAISTDNYAAALLGDARTKSASFSFITKGEYVSESYDAMSKKVLDEIFAVYQTRGTLLPLLHQPVLIQPILLDYPGYCAHLVDRPLDEKNYLMPHEGVRDVLRRLLRPLFPRAPKVVLAKRLAVVPTTFLVQGQSLPAWVLQYGIELAPHLAKSLDRTRVQSYAADVVPRMTDPVTKQGLDLAQRELIMPSTLTKMQLPRRRAPLIIT